MSINRVILECNMFPTLHFRIVERDFGIKSYPPKELIAEIATTDALGSQCWRLLQNDEDEVLKFINDVRRAVATVIGEYQGKK